MREIDEKAADAYERLADHSQPLDAFEEELIEREARGEKFKSYTMDDHGNMIDDDPSVPDPDSDD